MAEAFRKIAESAERSKAHVRINPLSQGPIQVDQAVKDLYLKRFDRMFGTLVDAGDSNTIMLTNGERSMELPRVGFANMVFDLKDTLVSMGEGESVDSLTDFHNNRRATVLSTTNR